MAPFVMKTASFSLEKFLALKPTLPNVKITRLLFLIWVRILYPFPPFPFDLSRVLMFASNV